MDYPFWDAGASYGVMMAAVATLHVFVSHFAIGGGLYLVVTESSARRRRDAMRLEFLQRLSKFFVLVTLVFGALTGVGIWFVIGLLNPAATEVLIHHFVWGWAAEWTLFIVEIAAAILYYYGWRRMPPRDHLVIGWVYFAAAWLSLFIINGIITFMLTPGRWLETGDFWDGFFNPTFWPSLVFRTGVCVLLAGLYALLVSSRYPPGEFKKSLVRNNALWGMAGFLIVMPSYYWYWQAIPRKLLEDALGNMPVTAASVHAGYWFAGAVAAFLVLFGLWMPRRCHLPAAILGMALGLGGFGAFEWFRESVRKPYVIGGYMYGNALEVAAMESYRATGLLARMDFRSKSDAADLFRRACASCHTIGGYNGIADVFSGTDRPFVAAAVMAAERLRGNMPPFAGTAHEAEAIAGHIFDRIDRRPMGEIYRLRGAALGREVYRVRCGICHAVGSPNDKLRQLADLSETDINDVLDMAADLGPGMPAFTAGEAERKAMIEYVKGHSSGGIR